MRHTLDDIINLLSSHHQRATYGAVAGVLDMAANGLVNGRPRSHKDSWIVAKTDNKSGSREGWPTGYTDDEIAPACLKQIRGDLKGFIGNADELREWLAGHPDSR
jgi:hypothetical protein